MPRIGDIRPAGEVGKKSGRGHYYQWLACVECGEERWTMVRKPMAQRCRKCFAKTPGCRINQAKAARLRIGAKNTNWKGGRITDSFGYINVRLLPDDFFYSMARKQGNSSSRYVKEHRLVMAKHIGRCLHSWEIVHHKNHVRDDNGIENLQLVSDDRHKQITILEMQIKRLKAENQALREKLHYS